jgi:YVTN family beta-propeller protein
VVTNILSDTISVIDLATRQVSAILGTGDRPSEVAITPDGTTAVIANLDSTFLSIIDLDAQTAAAVEISRRASQVEISPDGQYAYAAVVADGDGVWRVNLDTQTVAGPKLPTGNMGSVFFLYQQSAGMTLSHDGSTLVTCNSADNNLSIINTATWSEVARVPVGSLPSRATFAPHDSMIYVSNRNGDTVSVVTNAGAASGVTDTINVGDQPFTMAVTPDGSTLYVGNFLSQTISIVDLAGPVVIDTIVLSQPVQDLHVDSAGQRLYTAGGNWTVSIGPGPIVQFAQSGEVVVIDTLDGGIIQQIDTGMPPGNLAAWDPTPVIVAPSPHGDGAVVVSPSICLGDIDGSGTVDVDDLTAVVLDWGTDGSQFNGDVDGSGVVDVDDLTLVILNWGACP